MQRVLVRLLVGVLLLTAPAAFAQKKKARRTRPAATAPVPAPTPSEPTPAPIAAPVASDQKLQAQAEKTTPTRSEEGVTPMRLSVEGFVGGVFALSRESVTVPGVGTVESSAPPVFRWGGRLSSPFYRFDDSAALEWVATLGIGHVGSSQEFMGFTMSSSTLGLDFVPGLRGRFEVLPRLSLTGEVGMGLQYSRTAVRTTFAGETAQGSAAGLFRFAVGGQFAVTDKLGVFFEPIGLHAYIGEGSAAGWNLQAGVAYAL